MILDTEDQRSVLTQALDLVAKGVVSGANQQSLEQLSALVQARSAVAAASLAPPPDEKVS